MSCCEEKQSDRVEGKSVDRKRTGAGYIFVHLKTFSRHLLHKMKIAKLKQRPLSKCSIYGYIWLLTRLHQLILPVSRLEMTGSLFPSLPPLSFYFMLIRYMYTSRVF